MISEIETPSDIALISSRKQWRLNKNGKPCRRLTGRNEICTECDSGKKYKNCHKSHKLKINEKEWVEFPHNHKYI